MELLGLLGNAFVWIGGAVGALIIAWIRFSGVQAGKKQERAKQDAADQKARDTISETRAEVKTLPDDELDKRRDRWTRKP
jgi:hypothetical protein